MSPREQIDALMAAVGVEPLPAVLPCKKPKTHTIKLLVRWADDLTPVPMAAFEIYRGRPQYTADSVVKGKYSTKGVPPGTYRIFFPEIHESEIIEE
jgi:hypothetical protein